MKLLMSLWAALGLALFVTLSSAPAAAQASERQQAWQPETIDLFATLPVQNGGRVKPLESLAGLRLLMLNGKRTLKLDSGEKLSPSAWALEVIFFPEDAKNENCIRIENDAVLITLGLQSKKKRDWYSYNELLPARAAISQAGRAAAAKERADRTPVERQMMKLDGDLFNFDSLLGVLEPLRLHFDISASPRLVEIFGSDVVISPVDINAHMPELVALRDQVDDGLAGDQEVLGRLLAAADRARESGGRGPSLVPPAASLAKGDTWWRVSELIDVGRMAADGMDVQADDQLAVLGMLDQLERHKLDPDRFHKDLQVLHDKLKGMATERGDYAHIEQEVALFRLDPFTNALICFLLGFVLMAISLLSPKLAWLNGIVWALALVAFGFLAYGVTMRCIIRERPPVVSLYDTILFVGGISVLAAFIMEAITRMRVALGLSLVLGIIAMFLAGKYELKEIASSGDTMASVVAVLDTNYYLAIHVTTIAIGYSGGLLAAGIAHIWILGKLFRFREGDTAFYKNVSRMVYGALCFSLLFAIFGTVMGGVWANDSWGRFWGWDPKENGALLICLWLLLTLHARMGGFIRDRGLAVMAVGAGIVVAASWWGVNLLNVGLHSYGFTSGVALILALFWGLELFVMLLSLIDDRMRKQPPPAAQG